MHAGSCQAAALLWVGTATLLCSLPAWALQPPRPGDVARYKQDGTWSKRLAEAKALGNHRTDPALVFRARQKLQQIAPAPAGTAVELDASLALPPRWQGGLPTTGNPKVIVLLVSFPDEREVAGQEPADVLSKSFGNGDAGQYPYESLRNYYQRSSYSQLTIGGNVLGWYVAAYDRSHYSTLGGASGREALIKEALDYYNPSHDFSQYDNDGDGNIDALYIKWTGPDNGWANFWWACQATWYVNSSYRVDGKGLYKYVWSWFSNPEGGVYQPRVDIHETGHLLGLPDLYDYNDTIGPDGGVGDLDMMDYNWGDHNCFSKFLLGWLTPTTISTGVQTLALHPSGTSSECVAIMPGLTAGNTFGEFFMAQYRKRSAGNDPSNYPADGLLIWHIDSTLTVSGYDFAYDNSYTAHKLVRLMEADGLEEIEQGGVADAGDYYLPPKTFADATTPNSRNYAGAATDVVVEQLTSPGATMSARFRIGDYPLVIAAGSTIQVQSCSADPNLDPEEQVTVGLSLRNTGGMATASVTATLLGTGGATPLSGPQIYGVLAPGGAAVSRDFTFRASGDCGGSVTATLQLSDGVNPLDAVSFVFPLGAPNVSFSEAFDAVTAPALPTGWSTAIGYGSPTPWATSTASVDTAPYAAFASDPDTKTDNYLHSPMFNVQTASARLTFQHRYVLEDTYDGGVLEIKIGAGAFTDIITAGGSFIAGEYTDQISGLYESPIAGRLAWSGNSVAFITTTVSLPAAAAGQSVQLRWRLATDTSVVGTGWYVDSISIVDGATCCLVSPDFDGDGNVDNVDYELWQVCQFPPETPPATWCQPKDLDRDGDVDQTDFGLLQRCFSGHGVPYDPNCLN